MIKNTVQCIRIDLEMIKKIKGWKVKWKKKCLKTFMSQENVIWDRTLGKYIYYTYNKKVCCLWKSSFVHEFPFFFFSYTKMIILSMGKTFNMFRSTFHRHCTTLHGIVRFYCQPFQLHNNNNNRKRYDGKLFSEKKAHRKMKKKKEQQKKDSVVFRTFFTHFHGKC